MALSGYGEIGLDQFYLVSARCYAVRRSATTGISFGFMVLVEFMLHMLWGRLVCSE
jgi:hypothetical protein